MIAETLLIYKYYMMFIIVPSSRSYDIVNAFLAGIIVVYYNNSSSTTSTSTTIIILGDASQKE